jgi:methyl-accepting chemotaxis protein
VAKLAAEVNSASAGQAKDLAEAAKMGAELQLFTRQTAKALSEQTQTVESLAEEGSRQASSMKTIAASARQQATASAQIATSTEEVRQRLTEVVRGNLDQSAASKGNADELRKATKQLGELRRLQAEQAQTLTALVTAGAGERTSNGESPGAA